MHGGMRGLGFVTLLELKTSEMVKRTSKGCDKNNDQLKLDFHKWKSTSTH